MLRPYVSLDVLIMKMYNLPQKLFFIWAIHLYEVSSHITMGTGRWREHLISHMLHFWTAISHEIARRCSLQSYHWKGGLSFIYLGPGSFLCYDILQKLSKTIIFRPTLLIIKCNQEYIMLRHDSTKKECYKGHLTVVPIQYVGSK